MPIHPNVAPIAADSYHHSSRPVSWCRQKPSCSPSVLNATHSIFILFCLYHLILRVCQLVSCYQTFKVVSQVLTFLIGDGLQFLSHPFKMLSLYKIDELAFCPQTTRFYGAFKCFYALPAHTATKIQECTALICRSVRCVSGQRPQTPAGRL